MPIYEYRCNNCRKKISLYVKAFSPPSDATCTHCGGRELTRLFSTFARLRTDKDVYDDVLSDNQLVNRMMANDPSALVEWSRRMEGSTLEKDSEYGEALERMERGESWESVAEDMQEKHLDSDEASDSSGMED